MRNFVRLLPCFLAHTKYVTEIKDEIESRRYSDHPLVKPKLLNSK